MVAISYRYMHAAIAHYYTRLLITSLVLTETDRQEPCMFRGQLKPLELATYVLANSNFSVSPIISRCEVASLAFPIPANARLVVNIADYPEDYRL